MHREELQLPFKRYQMQPVWRADRPQKGRYREFWQFDGDIVGSDSLLNEVELMQIVDTIFTRFGVRVQIKLNNRKILTGIAEVIGAADKIVDITVAIDKLDKIGLENVNEELRADGLTEDQIAKLQPIISLEGSNDSKLDTIAQVLADSELWHEVQQAGLVDAAGQPTVSRPKAALLADMLARRLDIPNKWKFFEQLWHRNNMRSDYNTALEQRKSLEFQDRLKNILS
jgi:histidyl-tRNA synthetase